ncbi:hypothetical protein [Granulicella sp. L60]|jgi:predicted transcriptional regulator|uniref:hypothetical protein n=1 Tax=Granulicella sp. L60 TaxID=1641866 RepID=UPI00131D5A14|nr:hypothetical protein [Granulicella sp. L60]
MLFRLAYAGGMVAKRKPETSAIILPDQLKMYLTIKMQILKLDATNYVKKLGITRQMLWAITNGTRKPSPDLLKKVGLEIAYRIPGAPEIISPDQLQMLVVMKMQKSGLEPSDYAAQLGIHPQTLYTILSGLRLPPKSLMPKLELETVYRIL